MTNSYCVYDVATGKILANILTPEEALEQWLTSFEPIEVDVLLGHYSDVDFFVEDELNGNKASPRPSMGLSIDKLTIGGDGIDHATINDIPKGTSVSVNGEAPLVVNDGAFEVVSFVPSTIHLYFTHFPYKDEEVVIHAI